MSRQSGQVGDAHGATRTDPRDTRSAPTRSSHSSVRGTNAVGAHSISRILQASKSSTIIVVYNPGRGRGRDNPYHGPQSIHLLPAEA